MSLRTRIIERIAGDVINQRVAEATADNDSAWRSLTAPGVTDRPYFDLRTNQIDSLEAWRSNPLAFRIVQLTTDYVLGKGIATTATPTQIDTFIQQFWHHPLNNLDARITTLLTELSITGELFVTFHTNPYDNMTYVRTVPATLIDAIDTNPDDIEDELTYHQVATTATPGHTETAERTWTNQEMRHYAINRPIGAVRGQGDLVTILPWLRRYKDWLTDRVIINKFKSAYLWDITLNGATTATIKAKQAELSAQTPQSGSFLVHSDGETWNAISPNLQSNDAENDGHQLRLMIAAGAGFPLHWLGDPGTTQTRATATEMGEPTRRRLEKRQLDAQAIIYDVIDHAVTARFPQRPQYHLSTVWPDLTIADNSALATSTNDVITALQIAVDRAWLTDDQAKAMIYRFSQTEPPAVAQEPQS